MEFTVVDKTKWEELAPPTPTKKQDKYIPILDALETGEIIQIKTSDAKEMKGLRITLGRKSKSRGFSVEYRAEDATLYVKKSDKAITSTETKKKVKVTQ
jgi:hypothetical protein